MEERARRVWFEGEIAVFVDDDLSIVVKPGQFPLHSSCLVSVLEPYDPTGGSVEKAVLTDVTPAKNPGSNQLDLKRGAGHCPAGRVRRDLLC